MMLVMNRERLHHLLTSALFTAMSACGGVVIETSSTDGGGSDGGSDAVSDTAPIDVGPGCKAVADNSTCNEHVVYPCGLPFVPSSTSPTPDECKTLCAPITFTGGMTPSWCYVYGDDAGPSRTVNCASCAVGRKPADLLEGTPCEGDDPVAVALAEMARIEAASVHAFRRLEGTLASLGADQALLARVRRAARDEVAHARLVGNLAKERGMKPRRVELDRDHESSTFELALENAVAGCVHETLGVAYLEHQRLHAQDPALAAMAEALYEDELDHAALSWDLVAFFDRHLDGAQKQKLRAARERALDDVAVEMRDLDPRVREALGLPPVAVVAELVENLRETLYA